MSAIDPRLRAHLEIGESSDERFVEAAFELVLRRPPDTDAREIALSRFADGTLSRAALLRDLVTAPEFDRVRQLDDVIAFARGARTRGERPRHLLASPGTDERLIEVPWVLSRLRSGCVLEVGYAFAEPAYLAGLVEAAPEELVGVDLAEAEVPGFETVSADARELPFPDGSFDQILLVSTLEHIGADNELYGSPASPDENGRRAALRELRRVLRPDGSLLVTVPLGEPGDHGWFRQDDIGGWTQLFTRAGYFVEEQEAYELGEEGWRSAPTFDPRGVVYGTRGPAASAVLCVELSPRRVRRLISPGGVRRTARRRLGPRYRRLRGV
ncbi:class I SAM-dependent methyltransferase [Gaiella sp.]|uniref:class I SAM-dependent methyltransferase n=1 Tax=Gaiella sp. TaxID=2663207 RepID=UPI003262E817